uniref:Small ribosomal subunit protein uS8c n=2 Tax=Psilotum nudum TaxID=3240 RepID=RR8_PSINU|nr:ribosomal protein S8 [Psilotum nudum]Q8WHY7.1 RecName: Full=Small ribosomal subunit protein uS8c; AltName: Full=30S ribosomal protein S8, chloroplastic [Psilotum nudum]AGC26829.1 ribosomal protein S8 [Psilotum nudum]BAB84252.1 ribosomal protein S8 [Psilotum nudum]
MSHDTIADMISLVRNANMRKAVKVRVPATGITQNIVKILLQEGFIKDYMKQEKRTRSFFILTLKYQGRVRKPHITAFKRISKPSLRIYSNYQKITRILGGMGIAIISTSSGIMTDREARQKRLGGEIICHVW